MKLLYYSIASNDNYIKINTLAEVLGIHEVASDIPV